MGIKDGLGNTSVNFRNKPICLFTLVKIALMLMSKDNFNVNAGPDVFENRLY